VIAASIEGDAQEGGRRDRRRDGGGEQIVEQLPCGNQAVETVIAAMSSIRRRRLLARVGPARRVTGGSPPSREIVGARGLQHERMLE